jgi:hypothetical protein
MLDKMRRNLFGGLARILGIGLVGALGFFPYEARAQWDPGFTKTMRGLNIYKAYNAKTKQDADSAVGMAIITELLGTDEASAKADELKKKIEEQNELLRQLRDREARAERGEPEITEIGDPNWSRVWARAPILTEKISENDERYPINAWGLGQGFYKNPKVGCYKLANDISIYLDLTKNDLKMIRRLRKEAFDEGKDNIVKMLDIGELSAMAPKEQGFCFLADDYESKNDGRINLLGSGTISSRFVEGSRIYVFGRTPNRIGRAHLSFAIYKREGNSWTLLNEDQEEQIMYKGWSLTSVRNLTPMNLEPGKYYCGFQLKPLEGKPLKGNRTDFVVLPRRAD